MDTQDEGGVIMIETVGKAVIDIAEKTKEVREYIPSFLQGETVSKTGTVDINVPVVREKSDGLTQYQERLLKEGYGVPDEEIKKYSNWESFEKIQYTDRPQSPIDDSNELVNTFSMSEDTPKKIFGKDIGKMTNSIDRSNSDLNYARGETADSGESTSEETQKESNEKNTYNDLDTMKKELGKSYGEIKEDKPPNSPNLSKWFENGGSIRIEDVDGKSVWTYIDKDGREVKYVDGYPVFPPEAKHPVIGDINIGEFTGDRTEDKKRYLKALEELYGLTDIPDGYALHHDSENGTLQLVKEDWHKEFTHAGGHSKYKEG